MNLVGISFLISFGVGWGKIFWKPRMVKCWGAARSGTTCSSHFQAWLSPSHKQNQYPCSREEPKSTWTGGPSFWTGTCRELTPFPTWYCTFVFLEQAPPVAFSVFYFKCWSYNIQPSVLVLMLSPYLQNWWGTWKKKKKKKQEKKKKNFSNTPCTTTCKRKRRYLDLIFPGSHIFPRQCQKRAFSSLPVTDCSWVVCQCREMLFM